MLEFLLYLLFIISGCGTAYVISLYSLAVFIDPDEIDSLLPAVSRRRREFLRRLAADPRAFTHIAIVYKSFVLVIITGCALKLMANSILPAAINSTASGIAGIVITWLIYLLVVEYFPRQASRQAINKQMLPQLWIIMLVFVIFYPVVGLFRRLRLWSGSESRVSEDDKEEIVERAIETLADEAGIGEAIVEADEKVMIGQIFQLDQTVVREIMVPRIDITGIDQAMDFEHIRDLIRRDGHSRYPVFDKSIDKIVGLVYVKDLFNKMPQRGVAFDIRKYSRKPYFVPETKIIGDLLREFKTKRMHIAIVVDEYGGVAGLVTLEDIIEEIFGEIHDEHDTESDQFRDLGGGAYRVNANLMVEKLQQHLGLEYDQDDYDTVGGLIYDLVGSVPAKGQKIKWHDLEFEIESVDGQRIRMVKVLRI